MKLKIFKNSKQVALMLCFTAASSIFSTQVAASEYTESDLDAMEFLGLSEPVQLKDTSLPLVGIKSQTAEKVMEKNASTYAQDDLQHSQHPAESLVSRNPNYQDVLIDSIPSGARIVFNRDIVIPKGVVEVAYVNGKIYNGAPFEDDLENTSCMLKFRGGEYKNDTRRITNGKEFFVKSTASKTIDFRGKFINSARFVIDHDEFQSISCYSTINETPFELGDIDSIFSNLFTVHFPRYRDL
ncbi:hypothetical protein [Photobacterium leiognathi]|uniref:hypothetical protein n=1 Tax=Photobacterium leiognathi TaxID=553611 RepID=UPI00298261CA|nr:hypothetical protein [Photobacterium leiognathi]